MFLSDNERVGVALMEVQHDEGLTKPDIDFLFDILKGVNAIPFEVEGEFSSAVGFINLTDADIMNYDYEFLRKFIKEILDDMKKESINHRYIFPSGNCDIDIWMGRERSDFHV